MERDKYLHKFFPGEWKYVGDGNDERFIIGGKCPDFVNIHNNQLLLELFGDYWHKDDNPDKRISHFRKYGSDCLVIWESELYDCSNTIITRVKKFSNEDCTN